MTNTYGSLLIAILIASSACLATESAQSRPSVAIITGEIRDPTSREITFSYESPSALENSEQRVVLDSLNRFSFELPVVRGTLVRAYYDEGRATFFVEPGDSLHVVVEEGFSDSSSFSGPGADNNRFVVEWMAEFGTPSLDYEGLEVEDFKRQVDQRRRDQFEFLAERSKEYALSPGFVDYAIAHFNYEWANLMISYPNPTEYRFANDHENRDLPPDYYDFLQEIPLVDEKAIGTMDYHTFLVRTLDWEWREQIEQALLFRSGSIGRPPRGPRELDKMSSLFRRPNLSEMYDLADLELSEETVIQLDSRYKANRLPSLSQMVDLSAVGLLSDAQVRLDSMYKKKRLPKLSQSYDLSVFGLSEADQARIDSLHEKSKSYSFFTSNNVEEARVDTTGGSVAFYLPLAIKQDSLKKEPPKLSEKLDLSWLSKPARVQLDSMYEHRQPLKLSERIDLSSLGLSEAVQSQLDSITTETYKRKRRSWSFSNRYGLAKEKLEGRVLYWFLAGEVIRGFKRDSDAFALAHRMWEEFQEINPHPEYTEAVQAALYKALKLQPGQPAPEFTLYDLDGQPVSLNQFKGQVVLLDFWASWCAPCIGDLPDLRAIKEKAADQPLVFLNLSLDTDEAAWREAIDKHEIEGVHVRADGWGADVAKSYQVNSLPSYYLVDSQGLIVERLRMIRDTDEIVATIEKSL